MSKMTSGMFSSDSYEWTTPDNVFEPLREEFGLDTDVCATEQNAKLPRYFSPEMDGLKQDWIGHKCWMNPPYGTEIAKWVEKAATSGALVVALLPARTDTQWFHKWIWDAEKQIPRHGVLAIRFFKGRVRFVHPSGLEGGSPTFPSMIVVFLPTGDRLAETAKGMVHKTYLNCKNYVRGLRREVDSYGCL